ncbi:hypothetical protein [Neochlamydia sp. AcF95]|uniref:DUF3592 domain-containing protein n=1 Tax=Neochlamydia sp. AcF95 TaxID=2795734 RepID=UPI001BCA460B|nr:hypothetical protein [Neochlamydia sp. AcF95]MBS4171191.1 hypothetical protein [Neochlamydia sp. AcF95]
MHKNLLWLSFLSLAAGVVGWFTFRALYLTYFYLAFTASAPVENIQWAIVPLSEDRLVVKADYRFVVNDKEYHGKTLFKNDVFRNPWAAEEALKTYKGREQRAWYSPLDPQYSSLDQSFPFKENIYAVILWILLLYFIWIGRSVARLTCAFT